MPFAAGAATDVNTRRLLQHVSAATSWQFVVENKPGASSTIGVDVALRAAPDGYALLMGGATTHAVNPVLFKKLSYDPLTDFIPITRTEVLPQIGIGASK